MSDVASPGRIEALHLKGVGPFESLDLTLRPRRAADKADLHILVGPNGCGKTTVLQALAAFFAPMRETSPLDAGRFVGDAPRVWIDFPGGVARIGAEAEMERRPGESEQEHRDRLVAGCPSNWNFLRELRASGPHTSAWFDESPWRCLKQIDGWAQRATGGEPLSFAAFAYSGARPMGRYAVTAIQELDAAPMAGSVDFNTPPDTSRFAQWVANAFTKHALALADGDSLAADAYRAPIERVEQALRDVVGEALKLALLRDPLRVVVRRAGREIPLNLLPDGVKSVLSWLGDLVMRLSRVSWEGGVAIFDRPILLLLDEVDVHLHPIWQRKVLPMVQRLFPNAQVVITTHSPFVVASVTDAWVYRFGIREGVSTLEDVSPSKAGHSLREVLEESFLVSAEFDVETERELDAFYALRDAALKRERSLDELRAAGSRLASRSSSLEDIVASELAQVTHLLGRAA